MVTFRKRGGESVSGGFYWCFESGDRVHVSPGGVLPGPASATYYRLPRWILLTLLLLIGTLVVDTLPNMLKALYAEQAEPLVFGYGVIVFSWMAVMLAIVFAAAIRDLGSMKVLTTFGWRPSESYLSGAGKKGKKQKTEGDEKSKK